MVAGCAAMAVAPARAPSGLGLTRAHVHARLWTRMDSGTHRYAHTHTHGRARTHTAAARDTDRFEKTTLAGQRVVHYIAIVLRRAPGRGRATVVKAACGADAGGGRLGGAVAGAAPVTLPARNERNATATALAPCAFEKARASPNPMFCVRRGPAAFKFQCEADCVGDRGRPAGRQRTSQVSRRWRTGLACNPTANTARRHVVRACMAGVCGGTCCCGQDPRRRSIFIRIP